MTDPSDHPFRLGLTHDVDRVYKTFQSVYEAAVERRLEPLRALLPGHNPYWTFEDVMALEDELGVRSSFYFLCEQHLLRDKPVREWFDVDNWVLYLGRYDVSTPEVADVIRTLDDGGWEVGLHGSYESYRAPERLREEKAKLEAVLGHPVDGIRQHYLNLDPPDTWRYQRAVGLRYDATPGSNRRYGFEHGYEPFRPFDDEFVVFPLTLMECSLPDPGARPERAWEVCEGLLGEARDAGATMTVLWHLRQFNDDEFPGQRALYRRLVERALEMDAWVGPLGELYRSLDDDAPALADGSLPQGTGPDPRR